VLELDSAGWHSAPNLVVPDGIRLVYLPRSSPELQPAEHLWPVLDERTPSSPLLRASLSKPTPTHDPVTPFGGDNRISCDGPFAHLSISQALR